MATRQPRAAATEAALWLHLAAPLGLAWGLGRWLAATAGAPLDAGGAWLVAGGGLAAYVADRWPRPGLPASDNPVRDALLRRRRPALAAALLLAAALACAGWRRLGAPPWPTLALLAPPTLAYPLLKRRTLLRSALVPAVWTLALARLAAPRAGGLAGLALFLLLAAGTLLCDLKDAAGDRALGYGGAAATFGPVVALRGARRLLLIATGLAAVAPWPTAARAALAATALGLLALAAAPRLLARELLGPALVDWALAGAGLWALLGGSG